MKKLTLIFLSLLVIVGLSGCAATKTPDEVVTSGLDGVEKLDTDALEKYFDEPLFTDIMDDETINENTHLFTEHLNYETLGSETNETNAKVKTEITNIDMEPVLLEFFQRAFAFAFDDISEEEFQAKQEEILIDIMERDDVETITSTIDIELENIDDQWTIIVNDELKNALFGNIYRFQDSMEDTD